MWSIGDHSVKKLSARSDGGSNSAIAHVAFRRRSEGQGEIADGEFIVKNLSRKVSFTMNTTSNITSKCPAIMWLAFLENCFIHSRYA